MAGAAEGAAAPHPRKALGALHRVAVQARDRSASAVPAALSILSRMWYTVCAPITARSVCDQSFVQPLSVGRPSDCRFTCLWLAGRKHKR